MPRKESRPLTHFGRFVKERVADLGYKSFSQFVRRHELVLQTLNRWMRGDDQEPDRGAFTRLAEALGMDYDALYAVKEESRGSTAGDRPPKPGRAELEPDLGPEQINAIIVRRHEAIGVREAMGKLYLSLGPFKYTPKTYVVTALSVLDHELKSGKPEDIAIETAKREARQAADAAEAKALGVVQAKTQVFAPPVIGSSPKSPPPSPPPAAPQRKRSATRR